MQGTCNLECWCHVPTRGRNKPPCYLCVVQICSQSYKSTSPPSAPALSLEENQGATAPPLQDVAPEASDGSSFQYYSWRRAVASEDAAEDTLTTNRQDGGSPRQDRQPYLHLEPEDDEGAVGGAPSTSGLEVTRDFDSGSHTSEDLEIREEGRLLHQAASESPQASGRGTPLGEQSEKSRDLFHGDEYAAGSLGNNRSHEKENKQETWDLSAQIRSLVLGVDDGQFHDSDTDRVSVRQKPGFESDSLEGEASTPQWDFHRPGDLRSNKHLPSRVASFRPHLPRDKNKHLRSSQPFFKFNSLKRESEYQRINRIIRRETSSEAARRYTHRAESLPRRRLRHSGQQGTLAAPAVPPPHTGGEPVDLPNTFQPRVDDQSPT